MFTATVEMAKAMVNMSRKQAARAYDGDGLRGIQGPYVDRTLPELPSEDTTWGQWRRKHPRSLVLP